MLAVRSRRRGIKLFVISLAVMAGAFIVTVVLLFNSVKAPIDPAQTRTAPTPKITKVSSNILFLGNTFWGRYINDWSMASSLKYKYPFSRLNEFKRDQYDAWISGLECPTAADVHMTSAQQEQALQFNCSPDYLPEAAKWFTAFTLANNHTDNQGVDGFKETRQQLDKNGIQYFGHYDPTVLDDVCEVIGLPVKATSDDNKVTTAKLPIAICAYHGVFQIPPSEAAAKIGEYSKYMPVIAMPHMGAEYQPAPDQIKTDFYHSLIDNGADIVLGDHPHWVQTTESYKGRLIVYSMGNFMFDQQGIMELTRSAGINVLINVEGNDSELVQKWLEIGKKCHVFKDDCLVSATKQNLGKLGVTYKFGVVGTDNDNNIVKPASSSQKEAILERLNWKSTMSQIQPPQSSL